MVDGSKQHAGDGDDSFLMAPAFLDGKITVSALRELTVGNDSVRTESVGACYRPRHGRHGRTCAYRRSRCTWGASLAQEQRCLAVGNTDISVPNSAITAIAEKSRTPGTEAIKSI